MCSIDPAHLKHVVMTAVMCGDSLVSTCQTTVPDELAPAMPFILSISCYWLAAKCGKKILKSPWNQAQHKVHGYLMGYRYFLKNFHVKCTRERCKKKKRKTFDIPQNRVAFDSGNLQLRTILHGSSDCVPLVLTENKMTTLVCGVTDSHGTCSQTEKCFLGTLFQFECKIMHSSLDSKIRFVLCHLKEAFR